MSVSKPLRVAALPLSRTLRRHPRARAFTAAAGRHRERTGRPLAPSARNGIASVLLVVRCLHVAEHSPETAPALIRRAKGVVQRWWRRAAPCWTTATPRWRARCCSACTRTLTQRTVSSKCLRSDFVAALSPGVQGRHAYSCSHHFWYTAESFGGASTHSCCAADPTSSRRHFNQSRSR